MRKFTCGVKHNFDHGVIIDSDDRIKYMWNCSICKTQEKIMSNKKLEDFKTSGKVMCPLLTYE